MRLTGLRRKISRRFNSIYGKGNFDHHLITSLLTEIKTVYEQHISYGFNWSERDIVLITYGNSIGSSSQKPLKNLHDFLLRYLADTISHVHILPFFPYSSDDGFSVIDYCAVNPMLGEWKDIRQISASFSLMADLVINHISRQSLWFRNYLVGAEPGNGFFIETDPAADLSLVVRPRSLPLLTSVETGTGRKFLWTTFSADQMDLNYTNPAVLTAMMQIFLFYIAHGIRIIRLDAIAFLWKQPGTRCLHLPQTHVVVKLMRDIIDYVDPSIKLITETNVPNAENLTYFGTGDEAHMVYQFSLPPLLLHALHTADSTYLQQWLNTFSRPPRGCTFFNFTASHDGIGVRPLEGLLPDAQIQALADAVKSYGGRISTRRNSAGCDIPYELNITYLDALKFTKQGPDKLQIARFICSQTVMLALKGIPAFYIHSLLGTHNDVQGVTRTGMARTINRKKWDAKDLYPLLDSATEHGVLLKELSRIIRIRKLTKAFHPDAGQRVIRSSSDLLVFTRGDSADLLVVANLTPKRHLYDIPTEAISESPKTDLLSGKVIQENQLVLEAYQVCWISRLKNPPGFAH